MSKLEKIILCLFPVSMAAAMFVYGFNYGWDELRLDLGIYGYLGATALAMYFLIRKATMVFGRLNLSLWQNSSFDGMSPGIITMRFRLMMYVAAIGAGAIFVAGIFLVSDLMMIYSWSLLGAMVSSKRLLEGYLRQEF